MRVKVVRCPCGQTKPHRKFEFENGQLSGGFFSIAQGAAIVRDLKDVGILNSTEAEAALSELASSGLPAESDLPEDGLIILAAELVSRGVSPEKLEKIIATNIEFGYLSAEGAERLRGYVGNPETTRAAAQELMMLSVTLEVFSHIPPEGRETAIERGLKAGAITEEFAGKLREEIKDLPYEPLLSADTDQPREPQRRGTKDWLN